MGMRLLRSVLRSVSGRGTSNLTVTPNVGGRRSRGAYGKPHRDIASEPACLWVMTGGKAKALYAGDGARDRSHERAVQELHGASLICMENEDHPVRDSRVHGHLSLRSLTRCKTQPRDLPTKRGHMPSGPNYLDYPGRDSLSGEVRQNMPLGLPKVFGGL